MKKIFLLICLLVYTSLSAKDIFIKSDKDIYVHTIYCGTNFRNLGALKPSVVFTNSKNIKEGTYHVSSFAGEYSSTYELVKGEPDAMMKRTSMIEQKNGKKYKTQDFCLVKKFKGLPASFNARLVIDLVKENDKNWTSKIKKYTKFYGKPAYAKGKYLDKR